MVLDLIGGFFLIFLMVLSSGVAVDIFEKLATEIRVSKLLLATMLIGFSTSLPELFVGIASALKGQPQIALGDIIGANLANLSWIIGGAAIIAGTIPVVGDYLRRDLWIATATAMTPFLLMYDGKISRIDGLILVLLYLLYVQGMVTSGSAPLKHLKLSARKHIHHRLKTEAHWLIQGVLLVVSLGVLAVSSWMLINLAVRISSSLGVSVFWVGLLIISFGTTLPELILSVMASEKREMALVLGNILGSVVVNSTLILGIISLINPVVYTDTLQRGISGIFLLVILGLFWLFTKSKHKLDRWEGAVMVGVYAMFVGIQLMMA